MHIILRINQNLSANLDITERKALQEEVSDLKIPVAVLLAESVIALIDKLADDCN